MFDVDFYRKHGFQIFRDVIGPDVIHRTRDFVDSQVAPQLEVTCAEIGCPSVRDIVAHINHIADAGEDTISGLTKPVRDTLTGHLSLETRLSTKLWDIPRSPALRTILQELLTSEHLFMHMPPTARFVLPGNMQAGVPPHQDISYNRHMSDFLTIWVPLVSIDENCGGVTVYDGSGFDGAAFAESKPDRFWLTEVPTNHYSEEHCKMNVGDVLALNKWIIHRSMPNRSAQTRFSIDFRFFGTAATSAKHYLDMQTYEVVAPLENA